jgi:hypothetical protein
MNNDAVAGLIILAFVLVAIIVLVVWSCRIINNLHRGGERTAREIIKEKQNGSQS